MKIRNVYLLSADTDSPTNRGSPKVRNNDFPGQSEVYTELTVKSIFRPKMG